MLFGGEKLHRPPEDVVVFPRAAGNLILHIKGVESFEEFDASNPRPEPPKILKQGQQQPHFEDESYKQQFEKWADRRQDWLLIQALSVEANDISWEQVELDKPSTWKHATDELKEAGLTVIEINRLIARVYEVNALSERGMEAARANFLQMTSVGLPAG